MEFDITNLVNQSKEVKLDFSNIMKTSQDYDKYAQAERWGAFANTIGDFETIECTFSRLGYDTDLNIKDYHAEVINVITEKNKQISHLWLDGVTDILNPQANIWKMFETGDKIVINGIISKYKSGGINKLSLINPVILKIITIKERAI